MRLIVTIDLGADFQLAINDIENLGFLVISRMEHIGVVTVDANSPSDIEIIRNIPNVVDATPEYNITINPL